MLYWGLICSFSSLVKKGGDNPRFRPIFHEVLPEVRPRCALCMAGAILC